MVEEFAQTDDGAITVACDLDSSAQMLIAAKYLVGCDGARSTVRKRMGTRLAGTEVIQRVQSAHICAPSLLNLMPGKPVWMCFALNPSRCGSAMAVDGRES